MKEKIEIKKKDLWAKMRSREYEDDKNQIDVN
jgi:hypothetical protein